jgi:hypothetical protein
VPVTTSRRLLPILVGALALLLFAPTARADSWSLLDSSTPIATSAADDPDLVEVGTQFSVAAPPAGTDYWVYNVRFYRSPAHPVAQPHVYVYDDTGTQVAQGQTVLGGATSGVIQVYLDTPVKLRPGVTYTASYLADGYYAEQQHGFDAARTVGPVTFPANAGVYQYAGGFPTSSWQGTNYYVSPLVESRPAAQSPPPPPPAQSWSLLDASTRIVTPMDSDTDRVEVGAKFKVATPPAGSNYWVDRMVFYRAPQAGMVENRAYLYDASGALVAQGLTEGEGAQSGIVTVWFGFSGGVKLQPGVTYTVSYVASSGRYAEEEHGFDAARVVGPITFPKNAGVYRYSGGFPTSTFHGTNYYVSPVVTQRPAS